MLVKFVKSTDFEDRHYARGDVKDFPDSKANKLIASGLAADPEKMNTKLVEAPAAQKPIKKAAGK